MDEHEDSGVGPRGTGASGASSDEPLGAVDPLVEGAPVGGGGRARTGAGGGGSHGGGPDDPMGPDESDVAAPLTSLGVPGSPHAWVNAATAAGLGLMVVELLVILGTLAQGLAVERLAGDLLHKVGVAFLSNVGTANGLTIVVAAVLVALPVLVGVPVTDAQHSRRALALALGAVLALVIVLATPIAVRARLHVLDVSGQPVDALARRVLGTYTIGTLGTAAVALATCLGLARAGTRRPGSEDGAAGTAADTTETRPETGETEETVSPHP